MLWKTIFVIVKYKMLDEFSTILLERVTATGNKICQTELLLSLCRTDHQIYMVWSSVSSECCRRKYKRKF